jgi:SAM-dependent methyltransferase
MAINPPDATAGHWDSVGAAEAWQQGEASRARQFGAPTERMLDLAGVRPGARVLDVAAGTGDQTLLAARRVGPNGSVLATDVSASMLESAANAARAAGLVNVGTQVVDARHLDLPPASFDSAICRNGLQWIPEPEAVLAGIWAALISGGKLAVLVHGARERNAFVILPAAIIRRVGSLPEPSPAEPDHCVLGGPGDLEAAFRHAGFQEVVVHPVAIDRRFPSATEAAVVCREDSAYLRNLAAPLSDAQREQAWREVAQAFEQFAGPDGVDLSSESLIGVGTK